MMKKRTMIAAAALTVLLTGCGGNAGTEVSETDVVSSVASEVESALESSAENATEAETEAPTAAELEDNCIEWIGMKIYYPGQFEEVDTGIFEGALSAEQGYFLYSLDRSYEEDHNVDNLTAADVPEILSYNIYKKVEEVYSCYEDRYSVSVETEEATEVLGCPFIYRTGVIHTEESDTSADLHYAAYYGVVHLDVYDVEKAPVCWMAFSESDDAETLAELEAIVKNTAKKAEFEVY